jgi:hypothetical protein
MAESPHKPPKSDGEAFTKLLIAPADKANCVLKTKVTRLFAHKAPINASGCTKRGFQYVIKFSLDGQDNETSNSERH